MGAGQRTSRVASVITIERTNGINPRSLALRTAMDTETFAMYADEFNAYPPAVRERVEKALHTDQADLVEVIIAVDDYGMDVGHAALRKLDDGYEVKKVVVLPSHRGRGISRLLMAEIERIARDLGETNLRLQTGELQVEAIALYEAIGYTSIPPYGPYAAMDVPCYAKAL
jgi:GNAT superfamily N-acetyltransferase